MQNQGDKETALTHNIRAVKAITDTVKSTLGPKGMDKLMMDMGGDTIVTNVLRALSYWQVSCYRTARD